MMIDFETVKSDELPTEYATLRIDEFDAGVGGPVGPDQINELVRKVLSGCERDDCRLDAFGSPLARKAAPEVVRRGPEGSLQIAAPPVFVFHARVRAGQKHYFSTGLPQERAGQRCDAEGFVC